MRLGLTRLQAECLAVLSGYTAEHGVAPSYAEVAARLGIHSRGGVHRLFAALKERGHIDFSPGAARSARVLTATAEGLLPEIHAMGPAERRRLLALVAGLVAADDGDGGRAAASTIARRLAGQPRGVSEC